ncbi:MAG TPA: L,D-transpeptidase family protein [Steroidobacteraceae bacterium]|nr:L,D-transpeptidase family protein [Steroidobacteraceae bacterium]
MVQRFLASCVGALLLAAATSVAGRANEATPFPDGATAIPAAPASAASTPLAEAVRERIDHLRYDQQHDARGARIVLDDLVARFYETRQFQPVWQEPARVDALVAAVTGVVDDGLDPSDYHLEALRSFRLDVRMGTPLTVTDRADLELVATDALMLAAYHLYLGKVDPHKLSAQWNFAERPLEVERGIATLAQRLAAGEIGEILEAARPQHVWYRRGRERLAEYRAIAAADGWPAIGEGPTLRPGASDPRVPVLRRRLAITHDLSLVTDAVAPAITAAVPADANQYDGALEAAVKAFQARHGLTPDGVVGAGTRQALDVPVAARIDQIRVNLERARWTLHEIHGDFVLVDVAGFYVSYFRNDEPVWTSKVVVGRDQRETPVFRSTITYVVFNPTWTIPPGILVKDKLPDLKRNAGALKRMHIRVLDGSGREVDPYSIDWHRYGPNRLPPYQFRQDPGPDNALGLVKIMFPNPYLVYLHDSPAKSLYEQDQRTFSSGCIRVQQPMELARLVLDDPAWDAAAIDAVVAKGETRTVNLKRPVPVLILYWTAQPRPDGQVIFRSDVYGRDAPLLAALDGEYRRPAATPR